MTKLKHPERFNKADKISLKPIMLALYGLLKTAITPFLRM